MENSERERGRIKVWGRMMRWVWIDGCMDGYIRAMCPAFRFHFHLDFQSSIVDLRLSCSILLYGTLSI